MDIPKEVTISEEISEGKEGTYEYYRQYYRDLVEKEGVIALLLNHPTLE